MSGLGWRRLDSELSAWSAAGRRATLWLRDDDAVAPTEALDRLFDIASTHAVPLALAVIPAKAEPALARTLARAGDVSVLQHGFAHANHAGAGAKKSEFAERRPLEAMTGELVHGRTAIFAAFGDAALPVLAPPWNRIADSVTARLRACGIEGLSRFKPRKAPEPTAGVVEANTHVDLIAWRDGRVGKAPNAVADEIATHLEARRKGEVDQDEPTGLLAHHLVMDATAWSALQAVLERLGSDDRVAWPSTPEIFAGARSA